MGGRAELPRISVIVASHGRPSDLGRCLTALSQQDYPSFEIIVVADAAGQSAVAAHSLADVCHVLPQRQPHLSLARNAGLVKATGEFVAFIDDDAVAEPLWLRHHAHALSQTGATASVGYVRGRNGISFQSRVSLIDAEAETHEVRFTGHQPGFPNVDAGRAIKLVGTNMVVQRDVLLDIGGFDPAYAYYLEDSDVSLRLAQNGHLAAVCPLAEVHHAFAASARRTGLRRPKSLFDIGHSTAVYIRRHGVRDTAEIFARILDRERLRLLAHLVRGTCEPRDIAQVLDGLQKGWDQGLTQTLPHLEPLAPGPGSEFRTVPAWPPGHSIITSRLLGRKRALRRAEAMAAHKGRASVFSFSLTPVRHHLRMTDGGVWLQTGGQFGRSVRTGPWFRWCRFARRVKEEISRVAMQRGIGNS